MKEESKKYMQEITIKNYAFVLRFFSPLALFLYYMISAIIIIKVIDIYHNYEMMDVRVFFLIMLSPMMLYSTLITMRGFKKNPPVFRIDNSSIDYEEFKEEDYDRVFFHKSMQNVVSVKYITNIYTTSQQGTISQDPMIKRLFKDDLGELFINTFVYLIGLINYLGLLPILSFKLLKNREPLWLLFRNFMIEFDDGTVFLINSYKRSTYQSLLEHFADNGLRISYIPMFSVVVNPYVEESLRRDK